MHLSAALSQKKVWLPSLFYFMMLITTVLSLHVRRFSKHLCSGFWHFYKLNCYNKSKRTSKFNIRNQTYNHTIHWDIPAYNICFISTVLTLIWLIWLVSPLIWLVSSLMWLVSSLMWLVSSLIWLVSPLI